MATAVQVFGGQQKTTAARRHNGRGNFHPLPVVHVVLSWFLSEGARLFLVRGYHQPYWTGTGLVVSGAGW